MRYLSRYFLMLWVVCILPSQAYLMMISLERGLEVSETGWDWKPYPIHWYDTDAIDFIDIHYDQYRGTLYLLGYDIEQDHFVVFETKDGQYFTRNIWPDFVRDVPEEDMLGFSKISYSPYSMTVLYRRLTEEMPSVLLEGRNGKNIKNPKRASILRGFKHYTRLSCTDINHAMFEKIKVYLDEVTSEIAAKAPCYLPYGVMYQNEYSQKISMFGNYKEGIFEKDFMSMTILTNENYHDLATMSFFTDLKNKESQKLFFVAARNPHSPANSRAVIAYGMDIHSLRKAQLIDETLQIGGLTRETAMNALKKGAFSRFVIDKGRVFFFLSFEKNRSDQEHASIVLESKNGILWEDRIPVEKRGEACPLPRTVREIISIPEGFYKEQVK